jgi:DNA polymerase-3 subunit alpha
MAQFVHLHVHSQYSMLDSALRLDGMVERAKALRMPALALTDHGNMFGAVQFHKACKDAGIRPILGCEVNLCRDHRADRDHVSQGNQASHHLVLLARDQAGYRNLVRVVSLGWVEGLSQGKPRIDFEQLRAHSKGLVGTSACMGGWLAQQVLQKGEQAGREAMATLRDCFEPDSFFVELQDHGFVEQKPLNQVLVSLARELELPLLASNDCHYLERQHARAQMVLQCISARVAVQDMERSHHGSEELYFKSADEMAAVFHELPEAIENSLKIAEMCGGGADPCGKPMLPSFQVPHGMDEPGYFRELARKGLHERFGELSLVGKHVDQTAYRAQLEMECDVISKMGFAGYFLIVQDFINWAKRQGIPVGPGRGSGAGSIAAYAMRITDLDPIAYGLLFERFMNPERVSMPDFDVDFCMDRRDAVIDYVRQKYGASSVGQIATFHLLKSRSVVRDVGRVMGMTPQDAGRIATLVPEPVQGKNVPIAEALKQEKRLKAAYDDDGQVRELLDTAMSLENLNRHAGMHAAGVVISAGPLWDHVPVFCPEPGLYVTQYHKDDVEAAGLIKFDFLGLKTLTTLQIAVELINKRPDRKDDPFYLERIGIDDAATYMLLQSGETTNVFQLESSGMQALIKRLKPDCFEDIIALCALYRPGPLGSGMVDDYVEGKHGRKKVEYPHPCLQKILKDTFGVMVYQEQVMQAAREMAGYSLGGADLLRRAMGKKKPEEMAKQKLTFIDGARKNGHSSEDAERVFELMSYFSGYGFNKSHSAAYALIAYQCAYLKAHYPVEFLCATMTADKDKIDKVVRTVAEARDMGITVLPPDVNESDIGFTVVYGESRDSPPRAAEPLGAPPQAGLAALARESVAKPRTGESVAAPLARKGASAAPPPGRPVALGGKLLDPMQPRIRFGLGGVKGIGGAALEAILDSRAVRAEEASSGDKQPFEDLFDFASRIDLRRVNKGVVEALVQCGAMDSMHEPAGVNRARAFAAIDAAIERGKNASADRASGQTDLFGMLSAREPQSQQISAPSAFPQAASWERKVLLKREKATLGFYLSGHPLDGYREELKRFCNGNTASVANLKDGTQVTIGGVIEDLRVRPTRAGGKVGFFQLEDPYGRVEVIVREKALEAHREILSGDLPVLLTGVVREERDQVQDADATQPAEVKILLDQIAPLVDSFRSRTRSVRVRMQVDRVDKQKLVELRRTLEDFPGACPVTLQLVNDGAWHVTMGTRKILVDPSDAMLARLELLFGEKVCELR